MPLTRAQKEKIVEKLTKLFQEKKALIFTDFTGISADDMWHLRKKLHEANCDYIVAKKTLISLALEKAKQPEIAPQELKGQIGLAVSCKSEVLPEKIVYEFAKKNKLKNVILEGIINDEKLGAEKIINLAQLPSRNQLEAQLVARLNAPASRLCLSLKSNLQKLCLTLRAVGERS